MQTIKRVFTNQIKKKPLKLLRKLKRIFKLIMHRK